MPPTDPASMQGAGSRFFSSAYVAFWAAALFVSALVWPSYNWDIIGYTAACLERNGLSGPALHQATYQDIKALVPEAMFQLLTAKDAYRLGVYQDPEALQQQLPFYRIRYAYVWLVQTFGLLLGSFAQATILVSAACASLIVIISGTLFSVTRSRPVFLAVPPLVAIASAIEIARLSTPDALAALLAIALSLAMLQKRHVLAAVLIVALPLVRTEFLILSGLFSMALLVQRAFSLAALSATLSLLTYLAANHVAGNYGYAVIFNFTLIQGPQPYPLSMPISHDINAYVKAYAEGLAKMFKAKEIYIALLTGAVLLVRKQNRYASLFIISALFVLAHFLLFPAAFSRTYFLLLWACLVCLAETLSPPPLHPPPATTP